MFGMALVAAVVSDAPSATILSARGWICCKRHTLIAERGRGGRLCVRSHEWRG
jgi:hypothetical protein